MGLDGPGMTALVKADWPLLRMLDVSCYDQGGDIDTITIVMPGIWSALECLEVPNTLHLGSTELNMSVGVQHLVNAPWPSRSTWVCGGAIYLITEWLNWPRDSCCC